LTDDDMMAIARGRARPGPPESHYAKRKAREVWQVEFLVSPPKSVPPLVLGCDIADEDRVLVAVVYHTRSLRGSRYEVPMRVSGLDEGGFDAQSISPFPP